MITLINNQAVSVLDGANDVGPVNMPDGLGTIEFHFSRCTTATPTFWPLSSTLLWFNIYVSFDGGNTWEFQAGTGEKDIVGGGVPGGIMLKGDGSERAEYIQPVTGIRLASGRKMKATVTVQGGPLSSKVSVLVE